MTRLHCVVRFLTSWKAKTFIATSVSLVILCSLDPTKSNIFQTFELSSPTDLESDNTTGLTSPEEFASRRARYQNVCRKYPLLRLGHLGKVLVHKKRRVIYCYVPKAGCTFWKRAFKFANNESGSIFSPTRYDVHFIDTNLTSAYNRRSHGPSQYPVRLLVARDPLQRVLSAYLDKIYLPDFWHSHGRSFVSKLKSVKTINSLTRFLVGSKKQDSSSPFVDEILQKYEEKIGTGKFRRYLVTDGGDSIGDHLWQVFKRFDGHEDPSGAKFQQRALECGKFLSFKDFVFFSITTDDSHWLPTHKVCNPCRFRPTHVSHMSTFTSDAKSAPRPSRSAGEAVQVRFHVVWRPVMGRRKTGEQS
ncbi:carbohydrate sulfotransferase [Plakobranchus ocellatus]|uniref:Carbohydrate sulfotransferase n=1 Tax=Plakobranchus ocellatus TaxID=259542 RepID=A0AAV3YWV2_9GAST|nr:carbohydrate sulfotransferase [Plakobranchus ocellatus]